MADEPLEPPNPNPPPADLETANAIALAYGVVSQTTSTFADIFSSPAIDNDTLVASADTVTEVVEQEVQVVVVAPNEPSCASGSSLKDAKEDEPMAQPLRDASTSSSVEPTFAFRKDEAGLDSETSTPTEIAKEVVSDVDMEGTEFTVTEQYLAASSSDFLTSESKDTPMKESSTITVIQSQQQQQQQQENNETRNDENPTSPNPSSIESPKEITPSLMEGANEVVDALITQAETSPSESSASLVGSSQTHQEPSIPPPPTLNDPSSSPSTHSQYYYALKRGKSTCNCLYLQWQDLVAQTDQYAHAEFKTFTDLNEAIEYLYHHPCVEEPTRDQHGGTGLGVETQEETESNTPIPSSTQSKRPILPIQKHLPSQRQTEKWMQNYLSLVQYQQTHQNVNVPASSPLGRWIASQRLTYRKETQGLLSSTILTNERIQQLTSLGVDLERKRSKKAVGGIACEERWDEFHGMLSDFLNEHGHLTVPTQPLTPLRKWTDRQRAEYKNYQAGQDSLLDEDKIKKLLELGFNFFPKAKTKSWDERYGELVEFKNKHGHCKVPRLYSGLGKWVADQRGKYSNLMKGKKTNMTAQRAQKLTDLGMIWAVFKLPPVEQRAERKPWSFRFQELLKFKEEHGHTVVPQHYPVLGQWVHTQRVHYKLMKQGRKSLMTSEQASKLINVGFAFEVMPRKKATIRQSLGNPHPNLPPIDVDSTNTVIPMIKDIPVDEESQTEIMEAPAVHDTTSQSDPTPHQEQSQCVEVTGV